MADTKKDTKKVKTDEKAAETIVDLSLIHI